jgi:hypothetical protein
VVNREIQEYTEQEGVEDTIQQECEIRFSLAHSATIIKTLLRDCLQYLSEKTLARELLSGTYNIPPNLDPANKLILQ